MKRPLCLFTLLFAGLLFLFQLCPATEEGAQERLLQQLEEQKVSLAGTLEQKEVKNGKSILYLKQVKILNQENLYQENSDTKPQNKLKYNTDAALAFEGAVCYLMEAEQMPAMGSRLILSGKLMQFEAAKNEGQFDAKQYYALSGYSFRLSSAEVLEESTGYDVAGEKLYQWKLRLKNFYEAHMNAQNAGILTAMLLGDKTGMDGEIKNLYKKNGIAHVLAISGLHISLLGMCLYKLLRRCFLPTWLCSGFGILVIYFYGKLTGGGSSAFRAGCMFALFLMAEVLSRSYDLLSAMAFSGLLLLIRQPAYIQSAGFLLSFLAVLGLALVSPVLTQKMETLLAGRKQSQKSGFLKRGVGKIGNNLLAGVSINSMTFPVLLWFYYEFPMYSFVLNLMIIPFMSILLIGGILAGLFRLPLLLLPVNLILELYESLCCFFETLPAHNIVTGRPLGWQVVVYYLALLLWLWLHSRRKELAEGEKSKKRRERARLLSALFPLICMLSLGFCAHLAGKENQIDMLSIGQGDCVVVSDKKGNVFLMDGGSSDVKKAGEYRLLPYLKYNGISVIDAAFISHAHSDHYSAVLELLQSGEESGVRIQMLIVSALAQNNEAYQELLKAAEQSGCAIHYMHKGEKLEAGNLTAHCLYPQGSEQISDENDASMLLLLQMREKGRDKPFTMLFTGDGTSLCDEAYIRALSQLGINKIDCLKVEHHGARTSNSETLLHYLEPKLALISCGEDNSYGHPHAEVLERLAEKKINYLITDRQGQLHIKVHKKGYTVTPFIPLYAIE